MMRFSLPFALLLIILITPMPGAAQRLDELPKLAAKWPPAWAALVNDIVPARADFEKNVLGKLDALMKAEPPIKETYPFADIVLSATLRHHLSMRRTAPLSESAAPAMQIELQDRLAALRKDWLDYLRTNGHADEALRLADAWLPNAATNGPVRSAIVRLWVDQAQAARDKMNYLAARGWLDRIEREFDDAAPAEPIRKALRDRAETLFKESQSQPDAQALRSLEEAIALWPRLLDARDALERRKGAYRTLVVGVRALPEQLSPALAETVVERQALELLFDRLYQVEQHALGKRYRPGLAMSLPTGALTASLALRRDVYWSSGDRLNAADIRHTALLMNQPDAARRSALWRDFLDIPRFEGSKFHVNIGYRQSLLDSVAPLTFHVLPQLVRGKQLARADDLDFAKNPVGSGPFQYVGRKVEGGTIYAIFQANLHDLRGEPRSIREIRMTAWGDAKKDLVKPLPNLILDAPTDQLPALKELGYAEVKLGENPYVHFLAVNHRKASLASVPIRRAIAAAFDRQALLTKHFRGDGKDKHHTTVNGLFPRGSWASCPAPRVPDELYQAEQARSLARQAKTTVAEVNWTLKYPAGDPHVKAACEDMASILRNLLKDAAIKGDVRAIGLPPRDLRKSLDERDYDLLYTSVADLDEPFRLALFCDPSADATRAGGSNFLGYDGDVKLQELMASALKHRQFTVAHANMQTVHAHLNEAMPAIPLWQLDTHVLVQPSLRIPPLESREVFARVREWKLER